MRALDELSQLLHSVQRPAPLKSGLGNPGPLGLGSFALTTMALSIYNAGILTDSSTMVLALALFYGGIAQFVAGLYEYQISNTFGATAFCSYGAFWCSYAAFVYFIVPDLPANKVSEASGLFLLLWLIFTLYMTVAAARMSLVLVCLFIILDITFLLLIIGAFTGNSNVTKAGGAFGIFTAILAWYGSAAVVINSTWQRTLLPVGTFVQAKQEQRKTEEEDGEGEDSKPDTTESDIEDQKKLKEKLKKSIFKF